MLRAAETDSPPTWSQHPAAGYALALCAAVVAVAVAALVEAGFGLRELSPVFMLAVLIVAVRTRTGPALFATLLCFLGYNYFFFEPRFTLYISARQGVATIALFLAAALLAGRLGSRLAMQLQALRASSERVQLRHDLAQRLAVATDAAQVVQAAQSFLSGRLGAEVRVSADPEVEPAVEGSHAIPIATPLQRLGTIVLPRQDSPAADAAQRESLRPLADDVAQALVRARLVADLQGERVANETERLRNALLASVSHDLRTPLAGMLGAAESLQSYGDQLGDADRRALLETISEEGRRLDRYIENLLDMTRLGHGVLVLKRDWIGIDEVIGSAISRLQRHHRPTTRFRVVVDAGIGPVWVHPALLEQALFNVLENAARFSPDGEVIEATASADAGALQVEITDRGPGIAADERERVFEMFYSAGRGDRGPQGTGLGLAICRGMIGAHGGRVEALAGRDGRGTTIRITLPLREPESPEAAA